MPRARHYLKGMLTTSLAIDSLADLKVYGMRVVQCKNKNLPVKFLF